MNKRRDLPVLLYIFVLVTLAVPVRAKELTAKEISDQAQERNSFGFDDATAHVTLVLTSKRGKDRQRKIEIRSITEQGLHRTLVRFHAPADVAGTGFLLLEKKDDDDDQYLYLPALGKVKRITGSQRNQRFMGTDITYADLESRNLRDATSTRLADEAVGGNPAYVIESLPVDAKESQYGKTKTWVHKTSFVPLRVHFFDKKMVLLKTLDVKRLEKRDGSWVVMDSLVANVQSGTKTRMTIDKLVTNVKLSADDFTQRALQGQ